MFKYWLSLLLYFHISNNTKLQFNDEIIYIRLLIIILVDSWSNGTFRLSQLIGISNKY